MLIIIIQKKSETCNVIDNIKYHICYEDVQVNTFYESNKNNIYTLEYKLALNHHNLKNINDYEYYLRCVNRLYDLFNSDIKKYYIYFHPILGINDFQNNKDNIINDFDDFSNYIVTKTKNIFGIFFILIKYNNNMKSCKIKETTDYNIFILYCNDNFLDTSLTFDGNCDIEKKEVLMILQNIFI